MKINKLLIGLLASVFCIVLYGVAVACDYGKANNSSDKRVTSLYTESETVEFDYSPRVISPAIASNLSQNMDNENIEFDYSPRSEDSIKTSSILQDKDYENIEFDYSPRSTFCMSPNC